jgi:GT2 family glycosyltransferase
MTRSDPVADLLERRAKIERFPGSDVPTPDNFPAGTVGVVAGPQSRFTEFTVSLVGVVALSPRGSTLQHTGSVDVSGNCNQICRAALANPKHEWVWIMGDDHQFGNSLLLYLLEDLYSSDDVDVVVPHCLKRTPPWPPVVYSHQTEEGHFVSAELPPKGLTRIHAAGSAGMLIRRRVLERLSDPWFRPAPDAHGLNEDLYFCQQVREAGFQLWCDPELSLGHIAHHVVKPQWDAEEERWMNLFVFDQDTIKAEPSLIHEANKALGLTPPSR